MFIHSSIHSCVCACTSNVVLCILLLTPWGSYHFANSFCVSLLSLFECFLFTVKYSWGDVFLCVFVLLTHPFLAAGATWFIFWILYCYSCAIRSPDVLLFSSTDPFAHLTIYYVSIRSLVHSFILIILRCTITNSSVACPPACRFLSNNSLASSWLSFS